MKQNIYTVVYLVHNQSVKKIFFCFPQSACYKKRKKNDKMIKNTAFSVEKRLSRACSTYMFFSTDNAVF